MDSQESVVRSNSSPALLSAHTPVVEANKSEVAVNKSGRLAAITAKVCDAVGDTRSFFRNMLTRVQDGFQAGFRTAMNYGQRARDTLAGWFNQARTFLSNLVRRQENNSSVSGLSQSTTTPDLPQTQHSNTPSPTSSTTDSKEAVNSLLPEDEPSGSPKVLPAVQLDEAAEVAGSPEPQPAFLLNVDAEQVDQTNQ